MKEARPYQVDAIESIKRFVNGQELSMTLVAPMAAGKSFIGCSTLPHFVESNRRVWIVVDREELADQWYQEIKASITELDPTAYFVGHIKAGKGISYSKPVQIVQVQTLTRRLGSIKDEHRPDVVIYDEAHTTAFSAAAEAVRRRWPDIKQVNLTATPSRHGKAKVQYRDLFPQGTWHIVATARQMIADGNWKCPEWHTASTELIEETARRFSGVKISGGDYDDTSQAAVMIDLLDQHVAEALPKLGDRSTVWFCVNTEHSLKLYQRLDSLGLSVGFVSGDDKITATNTGANTRKKIIEAYRKGEIQHLITIATLTTGFDAPIASACVWLRRTLSVALWCQGCGRVLRKYPGETVGLMLDLAGNLGLHPFPEDIDWMEFDPCRKLFHDPTMVLCSACGHRHDGIPTPFISKEWDFKPGFGAFFKKDGTELSCPMDVPLTCHQCKEPVTHTPQLTEAYGRWLSYVRSAMASGSKPKPFDHPTCGIFIGSSEGDRLTPALLYQYGIWSLIESSGGSVTNKDRSEDYRKIVDTLQTRVAQRATKEDKLQKLNASQRDFLIRNGVDRIRLIQDPALRYRAAFAYAYINDKCPTWAYSFYGGPIPEYLAKAALDNLDPAYAAAWLQTWDQTHRSNKNHRSAGVCTKLLKLATMPQAA